ncbi:MAG: hypothetical protein K8823_783 [Cenarchaeum symbiont of Oopsacas minuta]|nr:hypothetical protein [Cenarchaeum symbiont of Oopsacas minuta]
MDSEFQDQMLDKYDVYLCSSGYEERTCGGIQNIKNDTKFGRSFMILLEPDDPRLLESNRANAEKIRENLARHSSMPKSVSFKPEQISEFTNFLYENTSNHQNILIDVTSFTRSFLYSILNVCTRKYLNTHLIYSEPEKYTKNYAQGLEDVIIMPSNPGIPNQSKKILLVLFLGWENIRLESLIERWEPTKVITMIEFADDERGDWNKKTRDNCKNIIDSYECMEIPALNPRESLARLEGVYNHYGEEYDICLANGGPKVHCFAISEFASRHPEVQIIYPKPYRWQQESLSMDNIIPTSSGIGETHFFKFPICAPIEEIPA